MKRIQAGLRNQILDAGKIFDNFSWIVFFRIVTRRTISWKFLNIVLTIPKYFIFDSNKILSDKKRKNTNDDDGGICRITVDSFRSIKSFLIKNLFHSFSWFQIFIFILSKKFGNHKTWWMKLLINVFEQFSVIEWIRFYTSF